MSDSFPRPVCTLSALAFKAVSLLVAVCVGLLAGCASTGGGGGSPASPGLMDKALDMVGLARSAPLQVPADPPAEELRKLLQATKVTLRLHAGESLNTDANGRSLSVVAHVYKLRNATAMLQSPYAVFKDAASETLALEKDIVEMHEVVLTPGRKYEVVESMPSEAGYIAVVALWRTPDPQRWKFVFDARSAARTGVTLGLHACALSVAEGEPIGAALEVRRLAGVRCPST